MGDFSRAGFASASPSQSQDGQFECNNNHLLYHHQIRSSACSVFCLTFMVWHFLMSQGHIDLKSLFFLWSNSIQAITLSCGAVCFSKGSYIAWRHLCDLVCLMGWEELTPCVARFPSVLETISEYYLTLYVWELPRRQHFRAILEQLLRISELPTLLTTETKSLPVKWL